MVDEHTRKMAEEMERRRKEVAKEVEVERQRQRAGYGPDVCFCPTCGEACGPVGCLRCG